MGKEKKQKISALCGLKDNEWTKDLIIHDSDYTDWADKFSLIGDELDDYVESYIEVLRNVISFTSGEFADKLKEFTEIAYQLLKDDGKAALGSLKSDMQGYIDNIDETDRKLY